MGLTSMFLCVSCGDDDDDLPASTYDESGIFANSPNVAQMGNTSTSSRGGVVTMGSIQAVSEGTTDLRQVAARLEIPRLKGGSRNLFVVHTVPTYGVNYCLEWSYDLRAQYWAAFRWDDSNTGKSTDRSDAWAEDPLIPSSYRSTQDDYRNSGYTRGHIVASEDRVISVEANKQTFYYSNMHPQNSTFNAEKQSTWWHIENKVLRDKYNKSSFRDTLYVVKGGTINTGKYGLTSTGIPVPYNFFIAILRKKKDDPTLNGYKAIGFWLKHVANKDINYKNYAVSIDKLEELTGIDFFCNLPDELEEKVENSINLSIW